MKSLYNNMSLNLLITTDTVVDYTRSYDLLPKNKRRGVKS